jgi:putative sigma-54 modulation protein
MFIDIRAIGFSLSEAIRTHVESRVRSAMGPVARSLVTVTARLDDINADHGGVDKRCSLVAAIRRRRAVVTEAVHEDMYSAVDDAAARLRRAVQRLLARRIDGERKDPQRPGALVTR